MCSRARRNSSWSSAPSRRCPHGQSMARISSSWFVLRGSDGFRGLCREPPFGPALLEAPRRVPGRLQAANSLVRVGAERAAAIRHDLTAGRKLSQPLLKLIERDRARAVDVPGGELLLRTHVDQDRIAAAEPGDELLAADRLNLVAEVVTRGALDLRQLRHRGVA